MMPTPQNLRETLEQLADEARDAPAMSVDRPASSRPPRAVARLALVAAALTAAVALGVIGVGHHRAALPMPPVAQPAPRSSAPTPTRTTPSTTAGPQNPSRALSTRPMTAAEITARTQECLAPSEDRSAAPRQGELRVRYAMVQGVAGLPSDGTPREVLLLEDTGGYFDCSEGKNGWYGKGGDAVHVDQSASGFELPTLSGGTSRVCPPDVSSRRVESPFVVKTTSKAKIARVTVLANGETRTVKVSARTGYVYVPVQVSGAATRKATTVRLELLDADGRRLAIQRYAGPVARTLETALPACS